MSVMDQGLILGITAVYLVLVIGVGTAAARITGQSREDFLMANRSFGLLVHFFALFATNMTAVVMIGAPGLAYQTGISAHGFFSALFLFLFPVFLMTFGYRIWLVGKEFGHITPGQIVNHRFNAKYLGLLVMILMSIWTIPYILVGVQGGGIVFESLTQGTIPYWAGALIIVLIVGLYVYQGGMRGTGWTNTFQGIVFLIITFAFLIVLPLRMGGFGEATQAVAQIKDGLFLNRAGLPPYQPKTWFSQGIIVALGAFMFPHLILRYMTANSIKTLKRTAVIYPIAVMLVFPPAVLIGFWGIAQIPELGNPDVVLPALVGQLLPTWAIGIALAGILAALMSSIDGQVLTLSTFFSEDLISEFAGDIDDTRAVWYTRVFLVLIFAAAYAGAIITTDTIIDVATFAFAGYGLLFAPLAASFYSRGTTSESMYVGVLYGFVGLWLFELGVLPGSLAMGFHPFVLLLITQVILMGAINVVTETPPDQRVQEYERLFEDVW